MAGPESAARAIDAMRRGWPIAIAGDRATLALRSVEMLVDDTTEWPAAVLISGERAATLKLTNQFAAASCGPVLVTGVTGVAAAMALADPSLDLATPMKGPFQTAAIADDGAARAAIDLARHAGLLPAFVVLNPGDGTYASTSAAAVSAYADPQRLAIAARARLPVTVSEQAEIVAFRSPDDPREHVALILGVPDGSPPVVRLHSECLTGDVLGSMKCDCGPQLHAALDAIAHASWGVLLYLRQEGRGIGLINKLRAYELQDQGFDTVDANVRLGFPIEARDFRIAARMLNLLGVSSVRLMTNNPEKVARLNAEGVDVAERLPLALPANPHNERYLATKRDRTGHQL